MSYICIFSIEHRGVPNLPFIALLLLKRITFSYANKCWSKSKWPHGPQLCLTQWNYEPCCVGPPKMDRSGGEFWQHVVHWERNGKPLQYSSLENPKNSMKRQKDRTLKDELPRSVGAQYATGEEWRHNSRKNEDMEPKWKQHPVMDVTGDGSKVWSCEEQYCIGTWNLRSMNQGKFSSVQFSHSVMSDSLRPHGQQHIRLPCPSPTPRDYLNSCPLSWWCHPTLSSSVFPFSSSLQSFPASGSFPRSQFFSSGGQSIGVSASASVLPMNIQDEFPLGFTGWISLHSRNSQESSPTPQFKSISSLVLNFLYSPTLTSIRNYWKNHSFD